MFHLPVEEMTITLQDVAIILGLRIDGPAVTGTCVFDVAKLCGELLGVTPPADVLGGSSISIWWLCDQLSTPAPDADEVTLEWSARGFILALKGSFLFADKKGVHILLVCVQEGSACAYVLSSTTTRFDTNCGL